MMKKEDGVTGMRGGGKGARIAFSWKKASGVEGL